jgi:hypothetical protein
MAIFRFSLTLDCPIKSLKYLGLKVLSRGESSSPVLPEIMRSISMPPACYRLIIPYNMHLSVNACSLYIHQIDIAQTKTKKKPDINRGAKAPRTMF